ncbi:hypothetical protein DMI65_13510 [Escherichia coli]|nr:hypothetical protein [Escherichia coli]NYY81241.1 hypothetical protein [Escherichia coli]
MNTSGASTALGYDAIAEGEYSSAIGSKPLQLVEHPWRSGLVQKQWVTEVSR